ncbi:MAG: HAD family phosphatase [Oscillospiraceae bacterium]|nr:HAD family phosphatase [Oscillospiraceae bacterium]
MRGAIFDMDGLLIDSERLWQSQWHALAEERGITLPESFAGEICGTAGPRTKEVLRRHFHVDDPQPIQEECRRRMQKLEEHGVPLKPGAREILDALREQGWRTAVASSSPTEMIHHNLLMNGVEDRFDVFASGGEVKNGKPFPDIFLLAAERLALRPEECFVLEDSLSGVEAGWRAGCKTIMVPDLMRPTDETRRMCAHICRDLFEAWEKMRE